MTDPYLTPRTTAQTHRPVRRLIADVRQRPAEKIARTPDQIQHNTVAGRHTVSPKATPHPADAGRREQEPRVGLAAPSASEVSANSLAPAAKSPTSSPNWHTEHPSIQHETIGAHLARMLQTAGHSWATTEHDMVFEPARKLKQKTSRALGAKIPAKLQPKQSFFAPSQRWKTAYFGLLLLALLAIPAGLMIRSDLQTQRYVLSAATKQLVGAPVVSLDKQLGYDAKTGLYQYNPGAADGIKPAAGAAGDTSLSIGGSNYYGVNLAKVASQGQTFTDAQTKLSFSLLPQFGQLDGKHEAGHVVYPTAGGQVIYTLKDNGLKEDVVLTQPTDAATLKYKLQLPDSLQAKLESDGSIGIYSADPSLFGNISYGSSADQAAVAKARTNGAKNNLVFDIPAPVITETGKLTSTGKASFKLSGNELTVNASNLQNLHYPISIDPSVVVQSANSFLAGNNEDNNATIATGSLSRSSITGGTLSAGWSASPSLPYATGDGSAVVTNGYVYLAGLCTPAQSASECMFYASINPSTGALGSFTATTAGPAYDARDARIVSYNGYVYMIDGLNLTKVVYYTKPAANGDITAWKSAASLVNARFSGAVTAYNGRLYVAGGCNATLLACSGETNTVESTLINTDGSLVGWSTTGMPTLPTAVLGNALIANNGIMYAVGGGDNSGNNSPTYVYYSVIQPGGTLGPWTATTALPASSVQLAPTMISNNYLYIMGNGTTTVYVAPIYANGSLGAFQTTASLPKAWGSAGTIAYAGRIYLLGGGSSNSLGNGTAYSDVISAKIDPPGSIGPYAAPTNFDASGNELNGMATVATSGYLYILGGINGTSGNQVNTVRFAPINADGSLGTWATNSGTFPDGRAGADAVAYGNTIYLVGGYKSAGTAGTADCTQNQTSYYCTGVQRATVNPSNGALTWSGTYTYSTQGRSGLGAAINNGYLYVIGGRYNNNSAQSNEVDYAPINADGTLGSFATTNPLIEQRSNNVNVVSWGGHLYVIGGMGTATSEYATPAANGTIPASGAGSWTYTGGSLPNSVDYAQAVGYNGYIYVTGGEVSNNGGTTYTQINKINADGTLGTWTVSSQAFSGARYQHGSAVYNGYLYVLGGCNNAVTCNDTFGSVLRDVQYAPIYNGGGGNTGAWATNSTSLTTARYNAGAVVSNGYLYVLGGQNNGTYYTSVEYAKLNPDGSLGSFSATSSFLGSVQTTTFTTSNGYIYKLGGGTNSTLYNDVQYAAVCTGANTTTAFTTNCTTSSTPGSLSSWAYTANGANNGGTQSGGFNTARSLTVASAYNGYLYIAGGCTSATGPSNSCNGLGTSVESAPLSANGTVGTWSSVGNFNTGRYGLSGTVYNGYLYIAGGCTTYNGTTGACSTFGSDVQYAQVTNGTLASNSGCGTTWCYASSFAGAGLWYTNGLSSGNGYLYLQASATGLGPASSANAQYAAVSGSGALGQWQTGTTSYATARYGEASTTYNGNVYIIGGCSSTTLNCSGSVLAGVQFAGQQAQPHVAHYSRMVDLASTINGNIGSDAQITRYRFAGSGTPPANGQSPLSFCWSNATTTSVVFSAQTCSNASFNVGAAAKGYGRYGFVFVGIDDSQSATFPDTGGSTITELDAYFHAAPNRRLRGGQTFTDNTSGSAAVNQLDTEGP